MLVFSFIQSGVLYNLTHFHEVMRTIFYYLFASDSTRYGAIKVS